MLINGALTVQVGGSRSLINTAKISSDLQLYSGITQQMGRSHLM